MLRIIVFCIIPQLLFLTCSVDSLLGQKIVKVHNLEYPFVVSFQNLRGQHLCTGTLITFQHILTAGQCLENLQHPNLLRVSLGVDDLRNSSYQYRVNSWVSYRNWAAQLNLRMITDLYDIAVVTLANQIIRDNVQPLQMTTLNKQQVQGKTATVVGWRDRSKLVKGSVTVLSNEDCERRIRRVTNRDESVDEKLLCTAAEPYVLLQNGDSGAALLDQSGALLGVHVSVGPRTGSSWSNSSEEFLNSYKLNLHSSVPHFRRFIAYLTRRSSS